MVTTALGAALSGLRVTQRGLDLVSTNVANAGTDGYTRKTLNQENIIIDGIGAGVRSGNVQRFVDDAILRDYRTQVSAQSYLDTREPFLQRVQTFHGPPEAENNIGSRLGRLESAFVELSASPDSSILQAEVVRLAEDVTNNVNRFADFLLEERNAAQEQIALTVTEINRDLAEIADLNLRVKSAQAAGQSTATLADQRDLVIRDLAEKIDITYFEDSQGVVVVQTGQGQVLADEEARPVDFNLERVGFQSTYPENLSGAILAPGTTGEVDFASFDAGGQLGALFELRDETLLGYQAQLDEFAHKLTLRFEDQGLRLFTDENGVVPPDIPENYAGFSANIRINQFILDDSSLIQSGTTGLTPDSGSNQIVNNILEFTFGQFSDATGTPHTAFRTENIGPNNSISFDSAFENIPLDEFVRGFLATQAEDHAQTVSQRETEEIFTNDLQNRLLNSSGVDTDEELSNLIELQQAYAATAQVIGTLDELFTELLNAVR